MMNCQEVEGRDAKDGEGEWNRGQTQFTSLHTASEGTTEVNSADNVIYRPEHKNQIS